MVAFTIWIGSDELPLDYIKNVATWKSIGGFSRVFIFRYTDEVIQKIVKKYPFLDEWVDEKKYALVSDFLRYAIAVEIFPQTRVCYMDTDVSLIRPMTDLLCERHVFACGKEDCRTYGSAIYLSNPSHIIPKKMIEFYVENKDKVRKSFNLKDSLKTISSPKILTRIIENERNKECLNLIQDPTVLFPLYPWEEDGTSFSEKTRAIHWIEGSWVNKKNIKVFETPNQIGRKLEQLITQF